ncbi:MAG: 3-phosphoshikimate 1-carboxyvinyltransferase [Ilumatobacteraceae bacterium]
MTIRPMDGPVDLSVIVPGSKSLANRALVIGGLSGHCEIDNVPDGDDCVAMVESIGLLGGQVSQVGSTVRIGAPIDLARSAPAVLDARIAGTTSRFLVGLASLVVGQTTITGEEALRRRPLGDLLEALASQGARVTSDGGRLPVTVSRGSLHGGKISIPGDVSSQFISALMMIGPYLEGGLTLDVLGDPVSSSYVALTASVMGEFGVESQVTPSRVVVPAGVYQASRYVVAPDASSASYPLALAAIRGGTVQIPGLLRARDQGDYRIVEMLERSGCLVKVEGNDVVLTREERNALRAIDVDMRDCSDLVPTWAIVATQSVGTTRISGIGFIRNKESDRIGDLATELRVLGAEIRETDDGLEIDGGQLHGGALATHHDHRLAMAFGVLGCVVDGVRLDDAGVVSKSWPSFWDAMGIVTSS